MRRLRAELRELDASLNRLRQAGRDSASAQLLLSRKRAELEDVICRRKDERAASVFPRQR
ncbi:MAG: hypothetical protein CFE30_14375 [Bradyrhizobium sp. PARBB1]|jgi:hypothetical protein|nr:MAG: hypothetical protein CFE30_14375 [Bradyrhizobium sp. PARBB1]PSO27265.1 hypothetical protein C7G43_09930 [Bradyrhizobium sp. MOS004]HAQ80402.1 hypothetical protein [Bradyrhizobium sp.]HAR12699.1 hypothetical protein [Bradyrhizobium sp.]HAR26549.1 hypothetical protein [Bradyrhizobium sp.]